MATNIKVWNADTFEHDQSEREYDVYTLVATKVGESGWEGSLINLLLYVDEETGIVTTDVAAYERSLK